MEDPVMAFSGFVFLSLFVVLGLMFVITLTSLLMKKRWKDSHEPSVSMIIPVYNEENNIRGCLQAIRNSDYPRKKIEIIVVDDGSEDRTVETAKGFEKVRVIRQGHKGKVEALNLGASRASNNILVTIDCDVEVQKDFIRNIVKPFSDPKVGAVSGAAKVTKPGSMLTAFQSIEYALNSLLMDSFSTVFGTSFWFWGAVTSLRKDVLNRVGGFSKRTETEDFEIMIRIKRHGYKTVSTKHAIGITKVPLKLHSLFRQRIRWWKGTLQTISINKDMFRPKYGIAIMLLIIMQLFWFAFSFLVIPLITYQIFYWLPYSMTNLAEALFYLFRWFNLTGPFYALYKIPEWGISFVSIFGILSAFITISMTVIAFWVFKEEISLRKCLGIFFYFPYTIIINVIIIMGALKYAISRGKGSFVN
jgi:cellulose synthase/poly-beta-1,6-N-acetylglucosamine synthase-like glycosyltransferase